MKKTLFLIILFIGAITYSQNSIVTSGGNASGSGSASYSIGQLFYTTNVGSNGSVTQGIQQGFEFFSLSNPNFNEVVLEAVTYPNPTFDRINLVLKNLELKDLTYNLYDVKGLEIAKGKVLQTKTSIEMSKVAKGVYILKINNFNKQLKTFKIIKK